MSRIEIPAIFHEIRDLDGSAVSRRPFVAVGRLYATDRRALIRWKRPVLIADDLGGDVSWVAAVGAFGTAVRMLERFAYVGSARPRVIPDGLAEFEPCDHPDLDEMCGGDAAMIAELAPFCDWCDGKGTRENLTRVVLDHDDGEPEVGFAACYLARLRAAGVNVLWVSTDKSFAEQTPAYFDSPEFDGLLMPKLRPARVGLSLHV